VTNKSLSIQKLTVSALHTLHEQILPAQPPHTWKTRG